MPLRTGSPFERLDDAINACSPAFHLPITELSGTTINDVSGNGRNGTLSGSVTLNNTTAPDGRPAALFAGGYIEIPDNAAFSVDSVLGFTVGCMIKFDSAPATTRFIMAKGNTSQYEWDLFGTQVGGNGNLDFALNTLAGSGVAHRITTHGPLGTVWTMIVARVQNRLASASNLIQLYKDTNLGIALSTQSGTSTPYADGTATVRIGGRADGAASSMNGYIRNAFCMSEAIDQASIGRIMLAAQREGWGF